MPEHIPLYLAGKAGGSSRNRLLRCVLALSLVVSATATVVFGSPLVSAAACAAPSTDLGSDTLSLNVPMTGTYTIWTRMKAPTTAANSINLQVDTSSCFQVGGGSLVAATWANDSTNWIRYQNGIASDTISVQLSAGSHSFKYIGLEADVEVDRIILATDASCVPVGAGDNCQSGDSTDPTINLTAPTNGATATGPVNFQATAADASGISKIEFLVDGTVVSTTNNATSAQYSWTSSSVANGSHTVTARATDTKNNSATSTTATVTVNNPVSCTGTPSVPTSLRVTSTASSSVALAWNASTPASGCSLQNYKLYRDGVQVASPTGTSFTDAGLTPSTTHSYTIAAVDAANHVSAQSGAVSGTTTADTTAPSQPANVRVTLTTSSAAALAWDASTDNAAVKDYVVYRNGNQVGTSATTSFTDSALAPGTAYGFTVRARDMANNLSSASTLLTVTTMAGTGANKGDLDGNGLVGLTDLSIMLSHWSQSGGPVSQGDVNASGKVDLTDLSILLSNWGKSV
jgi:chitodextrinase